MVPKGIVSSHNQANSADDGLSHWNFSFGGMSTVPLLGKNGIESQGDKHQVCKDPKARIEQGTCKAQVQDQHSGNATDSSGINKRKDSDSRIVSAQAQKSNLANQQEQGKFTNSNSKLSISHNNDTTATMSENMSTDQIHSNNIEQTNCELTLAMLHKESSYKDSAGSMLNKANLVVNFESCNDGTDNTSNDASKPPHKSTSPVPHDLTKLTSNFVRHNNSNNQKKDTNGAEHTLNQNNSTTLFKHGLIPKPGPFTVVQTYATRLRANHARNEVTIVISNPTITTRQGLPAVIFKREDFRVKLASRCKYTLVGKFTNIIPRIELIRKSFILQTQLTGG